MNLFDKINNSFYVKWINKYYYILLLLLILLIGFFKSTDLIVFVLLSILLLFLNFDNFLLFYVCLDFFSEIMSNVGIYGYILRVYQLLFLIKIAIYILKNRKIINIDFNIFFKHNYIIILFLIGLLMYEKGLLTIISFIFFHFPIIIIISNKFQSDLFRDTFYSFISFLGLIVVIYGLVHNIGEIVNFVNGVNLIDRFSFVTKNPNLSALYILISLFCLFNINIKKTKLVFLSIVYSLSICITLSVSSIILMILFFIYYLLSNKYLTVKQVLLIFFIVFSCIMFLPIHLFVFIKHRILEIVLPFFSSEFSAEVSSGMERVRIYTTYIEHFFSLPLRNILFGGLDITKGYYLEYIKSTYGVLNSHSFLIDMLYGSGIIYLSIFIGCLFRDLKKYFVLNKCNLLFCLKLSVIIIGSLTKIYPTILFYLILSLEYNKLKSD